MSIRKICCKLKRECMQSFWHIDFQCIEAPAILKADQRSSPRCSLSKVAPAVLSAAFLEFCLVQLSMVQLAFSSHCWVFFALRFASELSHFPEIPSQARRLLQNMIWNLSGKGKSPSKEAFSPFLNVILLFQVAQATSQPRVWLETDGGPPLTVLGAVWAARTGGLGHLCACVFTATSSAAAPAGSLSLPQGPLLLFLFPLVSLCSPSPPTRAALRNPRGNLEASVALRRRAAGLLRPHFLSLTGFPLRPFPCDGNCRRCLFLNIVSKIYTLFSGFAMEKVL